MAPSTARVEDTVGSVLVALIVGPVLLHSDYSVRPRGIFDWGLILAFGVTYVLLANWGVRRLRRTNYFSRTNSGVRAAMVVPILSLLLLLTAYLIRYALETRVNT